MFLPKNVKLFEKARALQFSVLEGGNPAIKLNVVKSWTIESFKEDTLIIKLVIDDPSIISVTKVILLCLIFLQAYDKLKIVFK